MGVVEALALASDMGIRSCRYCSLQFSDKAANATIEAAGLLLLAPDVARRHVASQLQGGSKQSLTTT